MSQHRKAIFDVVQNTPLDRRGIRSAARYRFYTCPDPTCGLHIVGFDENMNSEYEIILPQESFASLLSATSEITSRRTGFRGRIFP